MTTPPTTLEYATPAAKARLTIQATDEGIIIYDRPPATAQWVGITLLLIVALGIPLLVVMGMRFNAVESTQFRCTSRRRDEEESRCLRDAPPRSWNTFGVSC